MVDLIHCMNGITCWAIPVTSEFTFTKCHMLVGDRNGAANSRCTRERGAIEIRGTVTLSGLGVADGNLGVLGGRRDNAASISSSRGTSTSLGKSHSGSIKTEAGSCTSQIPLAKARTFLALRSTG